MYIIYDLYTIAQDKTPMEILSKIWLWTRSNGIYDVHDRRFYFTPTDIKNIQMQEKVVYISKLNSLKFNFLLVYSFSIG